MSTPALIERLREIDARLAGAERMLREALGIVQECQERLLLLQALLPEVPHEQL